jgi:hypothetical protein
MARRVIIGSGALLLPAVVYYGVPIILEVPQVGEVMVPEESYAELYEMLASDDEQQKAQGLARLRELREAAELIEAPDDSRMAPTANSSFKVVPGIPSP